MRLWNGLSISATYHISALAISIDAKSACEKGPFYKLFFLNFMSEAFIFEL